MNEMRTFIRRFRVRHYELDFLGSLNNAVYLKLMQEAAIAASTDAGYSPEWYRARGAGWVIRRLQMRCHLQARYGDELDVTTWVSDVKRVSSHREYQIMRVRDGATVARARVNWIYIDLNTGQPRRIPDEFKDNFQPAGEQEELGLRLRQARSTGDSYRYRSRRRVQTYELDTLQHVHHAVYLSWIEQAYFDAVRRAGHPVEELRRAGRLFMQCGHDIEYFEPAQDNDEIEMVSGICEMAKVRAAWAHEIYNAGTGKLLARDYSLGVFVNAEGKVIVPPPHIVDDLLRGPQA